MSSASPTAPNPVASRPPATQPGSAWAAAANGLVAGLLTVGLSTLTAAVLGWLGVAGGQAAPVAAVSSAFIDRTPPWLKDLAIAAFGTNDKRALLVGVVFVLAVLCAVIGILARSRLTAPTMPGSPPPTTADRSSAWPPSSRVRMRHSLTLFQRCSERPRVCGSSAAAPARRTRWAPTTRRDASCWVQR